MQENVSEHAEGRLMSSKDDEQDRQERGIVAREIQTAAEVIDELHKEHPVKQLARNPYFMDGVSRLDRKEGAREVVEMLRNFETIAPELSNFLEKFMQELLEEGTNMETLDRDGVSFLRHAMLLYRDYKRIKEAKEKK